MIILQLKGDRGRQKLAMQWMIMVQKGVNFPENEKMGVAICEFNEYSLSCFMTCRSFG